MLRLSRVLALLLATTLIASVISAASLSTASAAGWKPQAGAKFNVPRAKASNQFRLENQVLASINHARSGSAIRMAMFSYDRQPITNALIRAHKRGVRVQVLVNNHEGSGAQTKLRRRLGSNPNNKNFIYQCKNGCRSSGNNLHAKFYLFSRTGSVRYVTMAGSINMKLNGHKNQYNDLTTRVNQKKLHNQLQGIFNQMRTDRVVKSPYINTAIDKNIRLQMTPYRGSWSKDPINFHMNKVKCRNTGLNGGRTYVRVNMHAWDGDRGARIAKKVRSLYAAGCKVRVQYGYGGLKVRQIFGNPTKRGYVPVRSSGLDTNGDRQIDLYSHMKMMTISGNYAGKRNARVVITGSSNYQDNGIYGDELLLRIQSVNLFKQYLNHYNWMWNNRTRSVYYSPRTTAGTTARMPGSNGNEPRIITRAAIEEDPSGELPALELVEPYGTDSAEWRDE